ncbi:MAG: DUF3343 domain-containing protein [Clostridiaceae bacterium]
MEYFIITFPNTHSAMACEQVLRDNDISIIVIPTPTSITRSCGIAIRFKSEDYSSISEIINKESIAFMNIYKKEGSEYYKLN